MLDLVSRPNSIALSDRAVSVFLRRQNGGVVGLNLTFATDERPTHTLEFERIDPKKQRLTVSIQFTTDLVPSGGQIAHGTQDGQFFTSKARITFNEMGVIQGTNPNINLYQGDTIDVIRLIQLITTPEGLDSEMDITSILSRAKKRETPKELTGA